MKSVGITRRLDELGRIVIPKEIRKNFRLKEGDLLEINILNDKIILEKYSYLDGISDILNKFCNVFNNLTDSYLIVSNKEKIIACTNSKKEIFINKNISSYLNSILESRNTVEKSDIEIIDGHIEKGNVIISTIMINGDVFGLSILLSKNEINEHTKNVYDLINKIFVEYIY